MKIKAKLIQVLPEQGGTSAKGEWKKQTIIVETEDKFPKKIALILFNYKQELPPIGTINTFHLNIESREYKGSWFTDVKCWKIEGEF